MSIPNIDWDLWSQPEIRPIMKAVVHFPSGVKEFTNNIIASLSFDDLMFDSGALMFGAPVPATGSMKLIDYDQTYNPTYNKELTSGIKVELFLGLEGFFSDTQLGPNLVTGISSGVWANNTDDELKFTIPFTMEPPITPLGFYLVSFDYTIVATRETFSETLEYPVDWPESSNLGLMFDEEVNVANFKVQLAEYKLEPYGVFYTKEWSYDSNSFEVSVELVDSMDELLTLDNRPDADLPSQNVDLKTFYANLLELSYPLDSTHIDSTPVYYSFYESTQSASITAMTVALGGSLFFMPDGSLVFAKPDGYYETNITFTDEDIFSYDIEQTSTIAHDSIEVEQANITVEKNVQLFNFTNIELGSTPSFEISTDKLLSVDYLKYTGINTEPILFTWNVRAMSLNVPFDNAVDTISAYGSTAKPAYIKHSSSGGIAPYSIESNGYIQHTDQAERLINILLESINEPYRLIKANIRGCYGLWVGAIVHVQSAIYGISAKYVIIGISFNYAGAIDTTVTLQHIPGGSDE